jgi:C4-type Zn-finger protein
MTTDYAMTASCPKCHHEMTYVTSVPHPKAPQMQRTTFVCYRCNQTRSYILSAAMAHAYAALFGPAAGPDKAA